MTDCTLPRITRDRLAHIISEDTGVDPHKVDLVLRGCFSRIASHLADGQEVYIHDFGTFATKEVAARMARNPRTGEPFEVAAKTKPVFKPAKALKEAVDAPPYATTPATMAG